MFCGVGRTSTDTLTNKTITSPIINTVITGNALLEYSSGDSYSFSGGYFDVVAHVTSSGTAFIFTLNLPKSVGSLTPTLNSMAAEFRSYDGYLTKTGSGSHSVLDYSPTITYITNKNLLTIQSVLSSGTWDTNNTIAVISVQAINISFA